MNTFLKTLFCLFFLCFSINYTGFCQASPNSTLVGKLEKQNSYVKSVSSYCSRGPFFYELHTQNEVYLLKTNRKDLDKFLVYDKVQVSGKIAQEKHYFDDSKEISQHPIETDINGNTLNYYTCTFIKLKKIRTLE